MYCDNKIDLLVFKIRMNIASVALLRQIISAMLNLYMFGL